MANDNQNNQSNRSGALVALFTLVGSLAAAGGMLYLHANPSDVDARTMDVTAKKLLEGQGYDLKRRISFNRIASDDLKDATRGKYTVIDQKTGEKRVATIECGYVPDALAYAQICSVKDIGFKR